MNRENTSVSTKTYCVKAKHIILICVYPLKSVYFTLYPRQFCVTLLQKIILESASGEHYRFSEDCFL